MKSFFSSNLFQLPGWVKITTQLIIVILSLVATAWLIATQDPESLENLELNLFGLIPAAWLLALYTILVSERFRILAKSYTTKHTNLMSFLRILVLSRILNGILPQSGNIYRGSHLKKKFALPWSGYFSVVLISSLIDLIGVCIIGGSLVTIFFVAPDAIIWFESDSWISLEIFVIVLSMFGLVSISYPHFFHTLSMDSVPQKNHVGADLLRVVRNVFLSRSLFPLLLQAIVALFLLASVIWLILRSIGIEGEFMSATVLMAVTRVAQYISITPGNIGIREMVYGIVGTQLMIGAGIAVSVSVILRIMNWLVLGLLLIGTTFRVRTYN